MGLLYKIVGILLLIGLGIVIGVGYVWYNIAFSPNLVVSEQHASTSEMLQDIAPVLEENAEITTVASGTAPQVSIIKIKTNVVATTSVASSSPTSTPQKPVVVDVATLTPDQKKMLDAFGLDATKITITEPMITCAMKALGEVRFTQIKNGETPSLAEGLTLFSCFQKK